MVRRVTLGRVSGLYGVRGWVKLYSYTQPMESLLTYAGLEIGPADAAPGGWSPVEIAEGRIQGKTLVARFEGCTDRDQAAALVGSELGVPRDALPPAGDDEFYWADLVGLEVINRAGVVLGVVDSLLATGANDVLVVKGDRDRLVPFVQGQYVLEVDLAGGRMLVDWDADF